MKLIIPMAGIGKRMRPHTLTVPKPLLPVAGKPMVQHLVEDISASIKKDIEEIGFVIGHFGKEVENHLLSIAENLGAKGKIFYQEEALGTAHAIMCASELLEGNVVVAFADTLFRGEFTVDTSNEGTIWVQKVEDPKPFGVVKLDKDNIITDFVEKPQEFVSDLAIIGIYYFKDGAYLKREMQYLLDNNIKEKGEFQLTNALENMKQKGTKFCVAQVSEWLDCGSKDNMLHTNKRLLETKKSSKHPSAQIISSTVIEPCYIGENTTIINSVIGPFASIGSNNHIENSI
ncbi:MAG TPA: sugar phosphate nucleotidyltransferase, partial [Bacteroidia bacterium]|nr:sugar phosphate nucleotidyltransferase [Bacteroidia bacterium]